MGEGAGGEASGMISQLDIEEIDVAIVDGSLLEMFRHADSWRPSVVHGFISFADGRRYSYSLARVPE